MKISVVPTAGGIAGLAALAALVVVGVVIYTKRDKIAQAARDVGDALNPASDKNLAYRATNAVAESTGLIGAKDSIGTAIYKRFHDEPDPTRYTADDVAILAARAERHAEQFYSYGVE